MAKIMVNYEIEDSVFTAVELPTVGGSAFADDAPVVADGERHAGAGALGNPTADGFRVYVRHGGRGRSDGAECGHEGPDGAGDSGLLPGGHAPDL